jgi:putative acetyltransferase
MNVRPAQPAEMDAILNVVARAFVEEPEVVDLVRDLSRDEGYLPHLSLVAEEDGLLVGYVLFTRAHVQSEGTEVAILSLAPLAVLPSHQAKGVGSALVHAGLDAARSQGESIVVVLGHPTYYPRFGFRPAQELGLTVPHVIDPIEAWMVAEIVPGALNGLQGPVRFADALEDPRYW